MREFTSHTETIQVEQVISITCNACGAIDDELVELGSDIEQWTHSFGYGSKFDMSKVNFDICDSCYEKWTNTFVHKPTIN